MDCSRRRTLELGFGAVGSMALLAGCSDSGSGDENETETNESDGDGNASDDEQAEHPDEVGDDMEEEGEPTGYAPDANESEENDSDDENATAGPEQDD
ncbi:hypothetical protein Htur_5145 (plasmid) [Haloterrigena turkmenica DSM 5511]|uniref:Uncharacterized protein n=1 Tax=Haloterrigena turkmenica (strain ATCC 51198 / DSM 5511 / JCM 9101 / NCIMB 13204 / VKM B-1734 / 4k) TaxID=543526 RepID=D2S329_HALTV|nr:hypothetical protein [Haloterrigena turkmenica]ADB63776.1 hypothetical protein Htur_5145 [Haloterrigena turkmenica DSM 5511]